MSKILTSPRLTLRGIGNGGVWASAAKSSYGISRWKVCAYELRIYFGVPTTAKYMWLEFHTTPSKDRYLAEAWVDDRQQRYTKSDCPQLTLDGHLTTTLSRLICLVARKIKTNKCYVECYYK